MSQVAKSDDDEDRPRRINLEEFERRLPIYRAILSNVAHSMCARYPELHKSALVQDALVSAWLALLKNEELPVTEDEKRLVGWLCVILRNKFIDAIRRPPLYPLSDSANIPDDDPSVSTFIGLLRNLKRLEQAMEKLDLFQLQLLTWYYYEGKSYAQIGRLIDVSDVTARNRVIKAVKHLHDIFKSLPE